MVPLLVLTKPAMMAKLMQLHAQKSVAAIGRETHLNVSQNPQTAPQLPLMPRQLLKLYVVQQAAISILAPPNA
jgi:hypothetical protein